MSDDPTMHESEADLCEGRAARVDSARRARAGEWCGYQATDCSRTAMPSLGSVPSSSPPIRTELTRRTTSTVEEAIAHYVAEREAKRARGMSEVLVHVPFDGRPGEFTFVGRRTVDGHTCKGRGFCPSCGGKRMTGLAAELLDGVIPFVPARQFVLSMPHRLRYLLAYDHNRCIAVLRIFIRALLSFYRRRARKVGVYEGRTGTVTFIQRFGSAANLNIHFHVVALDGVFTETQAGKLAFHTTPSPSDDELQHLVRSTRIRVQRHLLRCRLSHGGAEAANDPVSDASAVLASCYAGSVQGRLHSQARSTDPAAAEEPGHLPW